jgi:hypothetical protein
MPSPSITTVFQAISILGCSLTVIRLLSSGLYRRYPVFTCYFAFLAIDDIWPVVLPQKSDWYFYCFIYTEPLLRIFCVFAVLELYRLLLERYKGLYSLGRWAMYGVSAISVIVSGLMLLPHITPAMPQRSVRLGYTAAFDRGVDFSLTIFILLSLLFLSQYPVKLSRNLVVHASLYSAYFLSRGTYTLFRRSIPRHHDQLVSILDLVFSGIVAACTIAWFLLLSPEGEQVTADRIRFSPEYEARMLGKLDALNQILLKSARS